MPSPARLFALAALLVSQSSRPATKICLTSPSRAPARRPRNADAPPTTNVTAVDGTLTNATVADVAGTGSTRSRDASPSVVGARGYEEVFGDAPPRQACAMSTQGTVYLTYTVVNNATYNIQACLDFCDQVDGCGTYVTVVVEVPGFHECLEFQPKRY
ncbi:hypothetical protein GGX14DRAFT_553638 [Mycena pura]|uniref:Apple domain-containing protein n=1 Tax=Mycena pura TaxID=153505 RepID=A0AAD7E6C3_9AGAR|nr:hypothetical protein GGX14DRAFT_553638 [Mycena pura]